MQKLQRQGLSKNKTELILDSASQATDESSDETHGEEDDMIEKLQLYPTKECTSKSCNEAVNWWCPQQHR
jgi:hypothetical protein